MGSERLPPMDVVLRLLLDEADSLQDVRDVVDSPLLDSQRLGCFIEIQHSLVC